VLRKGLVAVDVAYADRLRLNHGHAQGREHEEDGASHVTSIRLIHRSLKHNFLERMARRAHRDSALA
jgi:hypothetical protein